MEKSKEPQFWGFSLSGDAGVAYHCKNMSCAIILNHIMHWLRQNADNPKAIKDGKVWMYQSQKKMAEILGFLTERDVKYCIKILVEKRYLEVSEFNDNRFKRTNWYTLRDQTLIFQGLDRSNKTHDSTSNNTYDSTILDHAESNFVPCIKDERCSKERYSKEKENPLPPKGDASKAAIDSLLKFGDHVKLSQKAYEAFCSDHTKELIDQIIIEVNNYAPNRSSPYKDYSAAIRTFLENRKKQPKKENTVSDSQAYAKKLLASYRKPANVSVDFLSDRLRIETAHGNFSNTKEAHYKDAGFKSQLDGMLRSFCFIKLEE